MVLLTVADLVFGIITLHPARRNAFGLPVYLRHRVADTSDSHGLSPFIKQSSA